jgi:V-type H+-transporting ATPase subunit H
LEWYSARGDETFWRENAEKLTRDDCLVLRTLVHILERAADPKTLAVACHDLGMFATRWPAGRFLAEELGGKEKVARLMTHEDADVRKRAVTCMQRLLGFGSSASAA